MFHWQTKNLVADLEQLPGVSHVEHTHPGGDYDTEQVIVYIAGSEDDDDQLFLSGFPSTEETCKTPKDAMCQWVSLSDGLDSRGGLNSSNHELAKVYIAIRQYLLSRGASVIAHYDQIF